MTEKKLTNKPEKGNWEKVSRKVKAQNETRFADAYVAGYLFDKFRDREAEFLMNEALKTLLPVMEKFCKAKLVNELRVYEEEFWTNTDEGRKLLEDAKTGDLAALERFYREDADRRAADPWGDVFSDDSPEEVFTTTPFGGQKHLNLVLLLQAFLGKPSVSSLDILVNWLHHSGTLFSSVSVAGELPLREEFANLLSSALKMKDLVPYTSGDVKRLWKKYRFGQKKEEKLDLNDFWSLPPKIKQV